jgi:hypothetical protein
MTFLPVWTVLELGRLERQLWFWVVEFSSKSVPKDDSGSVQPISARTNTEREIRVQGRFLGME